MHSIMYYSIVGHGRETAAHGRGDRASARLVRIDREAGGHDHPPAHPGRVLRGRGAANYTHVYI